MSKEQATSPEALDLPNLMSPREGVYSSGQPSPEQLEQLEAAGIRAVVSVRGAGECEWDEREPVERLGLAYHRIPVTGPSGVSEENARRLHRILEDQANLPALVYCGSGNRVGALYALKAFHCDDQGPDAALEAGRSAGLTQLEPLVRELLRGG